MDALVFFAEYENPGKNKIWSDSADNMILNGIKYVHGEHEHDFGYDPISMFIKTGTFDENPRAKQLHDAAALRLRIQLKGAMKTMPIPKIDQKKAQEV